MARAAPGWKLFPTHAARPVRPRGQRRPRRCPGQRRAGRARRGPRRAGAASRPARIGRRWWRARARSSCRRTRERFLLWDLENYFCAYPLCEVSGGAGAKLAWSWAESLYLPQLGGQGQPQRIHRQEFPRHDRYLSARGRRAQEILHALVARRPLVPDQRENGRRAARRCTAWRSTKTAIPTRTRAASMAATPSWPASSSLPSAASKCARMRPTWTAPSTSSSCTTATRVSNC